MKIAFLALGDPLDIHDWSGTNYHMCRALQKAGHELVPIGNLRTPCLLFWRLFRRTLIELTGRLLLVDSEPLVLKSYARQIKKQLRGKDYDLIFSSTVLPIAALETEKPIVFFADASYAKREGDFYYSYLSRSVRMARRAERSALGRCFAGFYAADWAAEAAISYDVDFAGKIKVLPFGANLECLRKEGEIVELLNGKDFAVCKFLLVGVDWTRKGGDFAVEVVRSMNGEGIPSELHVVGCQPDKPVPDFVKRHGFISKKTEAGRERLVRMFERAHFFICPSVEECYGVVFCEASSFGLPSVATKIGGIPTIVKEGENGLLVEPDSDPAVCARRLSRLFRDKNAYIELGKSSFRRYKDVLNWDVAVESVNKTLAVLGDDEPDVRSFS